MNSLSWLPFYLTLWPYHQAKNVSFFLSLWILYSLRFRALLLSWSSCCLSSVPQQWTQFLSTFGELALSIFVLYDTLECRCTIRYVMFLTLTLWFSMSWANTFLSLCLVLRSLESCSLILLTWDKVVIVLCQVDGDHINTNWLWNCSDRSLLGNQPSFMLNYFPTTFVGCFINCNHIDIYPYWGKVSFTFSCLTRHLTY